MESTRIRLMANVMGASACAFAIGLIFAPMMRYWQWAVWPSFAVFMLAILLSGRAYRLWGQLMRELEQKTTVAQCSLCQQGAGQDCEHFTARPN